MRYGTLGALGEDQTPLRVNLVAYARGPDSGLTQRRHCDIDLDSRLRTPLIRFVSLQTTPHEVLSDDRSPTARARRRHHRVALLGAAGLFLLRSASFGGV